LLKIEAVLPPELRARSERSRIYAPEVARLESSGLIDRLHDAIETRHVLRLEYRDQEAQVTAREIEPLCLAFWGGSWTIGAWCRLREDFRSFRPDRIAAIDETGEIFADDPARGIEAYMARVGAG